MQDSPPVINNFFSQSRLLSFQKGEIIIHADDDPAGVFFIKDGYVRLYTIFADGRELTMNIFKPGSYFSMIWALGGVSNRYYFQALTPLEVYRASKDEVLKFIKSNPDELFALAKRLVIGLDGLLMHIQTLFSGDAYHRVVAVLVLLSRRFGDDGPNGKVVIKIPLTHQDIASMAGITRETASLEMEKLQKEKLISSKNRTLTIDGIEKLKTKLLVEEGGQSFLEVL